MGLGLTTGSNRYISQADQANGGRSVPVVLRKGSPGLEVGSSTTRISDGIPQIPSGKSTIDMM